MTYRELYDYGREKLKKSGIGEADIDARLLLEFVCNTNRNMLLAHGDEIIEESKQKTFKELIRKRSTHIPLQHLTGIQNFMGLDFAVNEHVLIPRQDTEILVEEIMRDLHDGSRILDMCTGSGCILISLLNYSNDCTGLGVDISDKALEVARKNASVILEKKENISVSFLQSDLFDKVDGTFDIIVSNPPYIKSHVIPTLMCEVREFEPMQALDGKEDGLYFYRQIILESKQYLHAGGRLFFEIGFDQAEAVGELLKNADYKNIQVVKDYAGLDRVVYGNC